MSVAEWVKVKTSQDWAVVCIHVPISEVVCPKKNFR
jgi:hypothetical protein